ncbi:MAG: hypothetical protein ISR78_00990 [Spirochaetia bacterium]|nr:hypothetical protein [Spirochaetia bacterium]
MGSRKLLFHILIFQIFSSGFLILLMFFNNITNFHAFGFTGLWYMLDLRIETNLATWLESLMMALSALPCYMLLTYHGGKKLRKRTQFFFGAALCLALFFSADEMVQLHEQIGEKLQSITYLGKDTFLAGFSWVFYYLPLMLIGIIWVSFVVADLRRNLPSAIKKKLLILVGVLASSSIAVILLEVAEAYLYTNNFSSDLSTAFEESFELAAICSFYGILYLFYSGLILIDENDS